MHVKHILVEFFLKQRDLVIRVTLGLVKQHAVPLAPLLLNHLLPPEVFVLLLFLLPFLVLFNLRLLLPPPCRAFLIILIDIIFILVTIMEELHLVDEGIGADSIDKLLELADHREHF
jgi:hypothetical protein